MLDYVHAFSGFSVDDLAKAKDFYSRVLGLKVEDDHDTGTLKIHLDEHTWLFAYPKPNHKPATFTILNFAVEDIEKAVQVLKDQGVTFEHYPHTGTDDDGIARTPNGPLIAWFKDPAGNILSVLQN